MIPFAVAIEGVTAEGQGNWVLAVTRNHVLTVDTKGVLTWHRMDDCRVVRIQTPDQPALVMPVQPKGKPVILAPNGIMPPPA
jgi:hypothetical protein